MKFPAATVDVIQRGEALAIFERSHYSLPASITGRNLVYSCLVGTRCSYDKEGQWLSFDALKVVHQVTTVTSSLRKVAQTARTLKKSPIFSLKSRPRFRTHSRPRPPVRPRLLRSHCSARVRSPHPPSRNRNRNLSTQTPPELLKHNSVAVSGLIFFPL